MGPTGPSEIDRFTASNEGEALSSLSSSRSIPWHLRLDLDQGFVDAVPGGQDGCRNRPGNGERRITPYDASLGYPDAGLSGSTISGGSGYNCPSRSINGFAAGVLSWVGSLTGWSQVSVRMPASVSIERIVDRQASNVNSVPSRRSSTRALGSVGGVSVWMSAQQRSKIVVRSSNGTLSVLRSAVQRADTNRTNCKSGIPGFWTSNDGMGEHYRWQPKRSQRVQYLRLPRRYHD